MDSKRTSSFSDSSSPYEKKIPKWAMWRQIRIKVITSMLLLIAIWQFPEFPEEKWFSTAASYGHYLKRIFRGRRFLFRGSTLRASQEFGWGLDKSRLCSKGEHFWNTYILWNRHNRWKHAIRKENRSNPIFQVWMCRNIPEAFKLCLSLASA